MRVVPLLEYIVEEVNTCVLVCTFVLKKKKKKKKKKKETIWLH